MRVNVGRADAAFVLDATQSALNGFSGCDNAIRKRKSGSLPEMWLIPDRRRIQPREIPAVYSACEKMRLEHCKKRTEVNSSTFREADFCSCGSFRIPKRLAIRFDLSPLNLSRKIRSEQTNASDRTSSVY